MTARHETRKPLFTRRHYEALAGAFKGARQSIINGVAPDAGLLEWLAAANAIERELGDMLLDDNPRFDRERFNEASRQPWPA